MSDESLFSKEGTIARPSQEIVKYFYLHRLEDIMRRQIAYYDTDNISAGNKSALRRWKSSLITLRGLCLPRLEKKMQEQKEYRYEPNKILSLILSDKETDVNKAHNMLMSYLELDLKLTKVDTQRNFEATDIMGKNKARLGY